MYKVLHRDHKQTHTTFNATAMLPSITPRHTPEASRLKENQRAKTRASSQRLGRVPLSPAKSGALDALSKDLDTLSLAAPKQRAHPLAAPPSHSSLARSSSDSQTDAPNKPYQFVPSDTNKPKTYKPIEDYNSPIQLLTRDPDWARLAPQSQHGVLGIGNMPLNLTSVVKNDWQGRKTEVSDETKSQAKNLSKGVNLPKPVSNDPDLAGTDAPAHSNAIVHHGAVCICPDSPQ